MACVVIWGQGLPLTVQIARYSLITFVLHSFLLCDITRQQKHVSWELTNFRICGDDRLSVWPRYIFIRLRQVLGTTLSSFSRLWKVEIIPSFLKHLICVFYHTTVDDFIAGADDTEQASVSRGASPHLFQASRTLSAFSTTAVIVGLPSTFKVKQEYKNQN